MVKKLAVVLMLAMAGCASPIGINRVSVNEAYQQITASAFTGPDLSSDSLIVMRRYGVLELYDTDPDAAIKKLHGIACGEVPHQVLFALSEMSYGAARRFEKWTWVDISGTRYPGKRAARAYDAAAAVYAYLYLFTPGAESNLFDPRSRLACNFYNRALANALKPEGSDRIELKSTRVLDLPMGKLSVTASRPGFPWNEKQFHGFIATDDFVVRGLSCRTREAGLGVPLIALPDPAAFGEKWPDYYLKSIKVPATAFLQIHGTLKDMSGDGLKATLELYCPYNAQTAMVNGHPVPLEADLTAPMAYSLESSEMWRAEIAQFLSGQELFKTAIYLTEPYAPGKIPVVFVHGTTSSPARWAEMFNTLQGDPVLRQRYQFWFFIYNSGQPVAYSAALLREKLAAITKELDPTGQDAALRKIVLVGHSQGGLLCRLQVVESGDRLWKNISSEPFEQAKLPADAKALFQRALFFEPIPSVHRVIFICTPHRGSYRIAGFVQNMAQRLMTLPGNVLQATTALLAGNATAMPKEFRKSVPTSIANMRPGSPFLNAVNEMPFAANVKLNSIIAVQPGMEIATGNDGIVAYQDAHLDNTESEFVERWSHSCQGQPAVIEEVRRILIQSLTLPASSSKSE